MNTFSVFIFFGFRYVMYRKTKNLKDKIYIQVHMNAFSVFIYFWLSIRNVWENQKSERYIFWLENQKIIGNLWDVVLACFFCQKPVRKLRRISSDFVEKPKISSKNQKFRRNSSDDFFGFFGVGCQFFAWILTHLNQGNFLLIVL